MPSPAQPPRRLALLVATLTLVPTACTGVPEVETSVPTTSVSATKTPTPQLLTLQDIIDLPAESPALRREGPATPVAGETATAISYISGGLDVTGVLRVPQGQGPFPVVVVVHGGVDPERYTSGGDLVPEQQALVESGYAVVAVDMRGYAGSDPADIDSVAVDPGFGWLTILDWGMALDVVNSLRMLRDGAVTEADPRRVGLLGHSMGGLLALDAAVIAPGASDVVVALAAGPSDFPEAFGDLERARPGMLDEFSESAGQQAVGSPYWDAISPRRHFDRATEPLFMIHGTADDATLPQWSQATVAAWQAAGNPAEAVLIEGGDHHMKPHRSESVRLTVAAFDAVIGR